MEYIWITYVLGFFLPIFLESTIMAFPWDKYGLYSVDACPANLSEWELASRKLNCTMQQNVFENRYHCVATRDRTHLVEFCYPRTRSIFGKGQCVILDPPFTLDNYTCLHFTDGCPDTYYFTDQLYKYPGCLMIEPVLKCFISDESCMKRSRITTSQNEESTTQAFLAHNITKQVQEKEYLVEILLPTSILLGIVFGIAIFAMIYRKRRQVSRFFKIEDLEKSGENEGELLLHSRYETEISDVNKLNNTTFIPTFEEDNSEKGEGSLIAVQYECQQDEGNDAASLLHNMTVGLREKTYQNVKGFQMVKPKDTGGYVQVRIDVTVKFRKSNSKRVQEKAYKYAKGFMVEKQIESFVKPKDTEIPYIV